MVKNITIKPNIRLKKNYQIAILNLVPRTFTLAGNEVVQSCTDPESQLHHEKKRAEILSKKEELARPIWDLNPWPSD